MVVTCLSESQNARSSNIPSRMKGSVPKEKEVAFSQRLCRRWRRRVDDGRGPSEGAEAIKTSHRLPLNSNSPVNYRKSGEDSCSASAVFLARGAVIQIANEGPLAT